MTDHDTPQTKCCGHYPNRVLQKKDVAAELGVCERTVSNLMRAGALPEPAWLNSIPVWMLHDLHAFISARAGAAQPDGYSAKAEESSKAKARQSGKHKAGKYSA